MRSGEANCPYCDDAMAHPVAGHCGRPLCALANSRAAAERAVDARRVEAGAARARVAEAVAPVLARVQAEDGAGARPLLGAVTHRVPVLVAAEEGRRAAFLAHVARLCDEAFRVDVEAIGDVYDRKAQEPEEPDVVGRACASCRGSCCIRGFGQMAFVKLGTIQGFRRAEPGLTKEAVLARYEAHFPEESSAGGCLFQGPMGCTLPRSHRAGICNTFHCELLDALIEEAEGAAGPVVVVAADEAGVQVVSVMARDGSWEEVEA
ncbi:hypothetical protein [Oceanicola sp. 502str15]|uniref:hypothetical protein n=1 Tax=Oceanicola sp. 502str15 TaxID=2696061 RepID=UPI002095D3F3|nr:hypothetical protein [Oceanicola sp. 502str15]MCO6382233.1 hypothetical protein [Oceanicola sp. 502str15]